MTAFSPLPSAAPSPSPMRIAAVIWLMVAAALLLYFLAANLFLRLKLNRLPRFSDARVNKVLAQCRAELRVGAPVRLAVTERPKPPAVFGVFRPVILLPRAAAEGCSENEPRYIFLHELTGSIPSSGTPCIRCPKTAKFPATPVSSPVSVEKNAEATETPSSE